jgi:hypothetical protein
MSSDAEQLSLVIGETELGVPERTFLSVLKGERRCPCFPCARPVFYLQITAFLVALTSFSLNILSLLGVRIGAVKTVDVVLNGTRIECLVDANSPMS